MSNKITLTIDHSKTWFNYQVRTKENIPVGNVYMKNDELFYDKTLEKPYFLPSLMMDTIAKKAKEDNYIVVVTEVWQSNKN